MSSDGVTERARRAGGAAAPPASSRRPAKDKLTPVMRQYDDAKRAYPDAIVFFRLGDFYEMFHEDAVLASELLKLTLTSRNKGAPDEVPMAGVPHHAAHGYIARLLAAGHKVALCEQMGDPSKIKGIVPREVVRVVTPGLVVTGDLDARENHYLAAVDVDAGEKGVDGTSRFGLALLDLSTGELSSLTLEGAAELTCEIVRASPREVVFARNAWSFAADLAPVLRGVATRDDGELAERVEVTIERELGAQAWNDAAGAHTPVALAAAARALAFARRCTPHGPLPVRRISTRDGSGTMRIDETAQAHLELVRALDGSREGTLLSVLDRTVTPAGARLLRQRVLTPLADVGAIRRRLDEVDTFVRHPRARAELLTTLARVGDLERLAVRATLGDATPRDLGTLRDGLVAAPEVIAIARSLPPGDVEMLGAVGLDPLVELAGALDSALGERPVGLARDGGYVREGFDSGLDETRKTKRNGAELVLALEGRLREETGSSTLKIRYNGVFGYYIEVTRSQLAKVPATWRRKQTIAGGERYSIDALDQLAADIETAGDRAQARELEIFTDLVARVVASADAVKKLARSLAAWDVAAALAEVAHRHDYVRPVVDGGDEIVIEEGRHPVVERHAALGRFVPNDTRLDLSGERLWLVTGPNMAGKSTLMRQVALITLLAQMGSFVPAKRATIGLVDRLLSRVGASDNVARGESTFMVEMRETAAILRQATPRSLVILDEIGRGTSTYDGLSIAWAVAEHLHDACRCRALFATHYHELTELSKAAQGIANVSVSAREHDGGVVFLHTLSKGPASRSYGIAVARLAGLPESVLARARDLLAELEGERGKRGAAGKPQLDLFGDAPAAKHELPSPPSDTERRVREADLDRMTPLDALTFLAELKRGLPAK